MFTESNVICLSVNILLCFEHTLDICLCLIIVLRDVRIRNISSKLQTHERLKRTQIFIGQCKNVHIFGVDSSPRFFKVTKRQLNDDR